MNGMSKLERKKMLARSTRNAHVPLAKRFRMIGTPLYERGCSVSGAVIAKKEKDARTTDVAFRVIRHNLSEISRLSLPCTKALMDQSWVQLVDQSWVQLGAHVQ